MPSCACRQPGDSGFLFGRVIRTAANAGIRNFDALLSYVCIGRSKSENAPGPVQVDDVGTPAPPSAPDEHDSLDSRHLPDRRASRPMGTRGGLVWLAEAADLCGLTAGV